MTEERCADGENRSIPLHFDFGLADFPGGMTWTL